MKRVVTAVAVAALALGLSACGEKSPADKCLEDEEVKTVAAQMGMPAAQVCLELLNEDPEKFSAYFGE